MTTDSELSKHYDPQEFESKLYMHWESLGLFKADANDPRPPFTIVIPPPNVTGVLHMGHALDNTLQDILIRYKRMDGFAALWVPGTDHAGIATQAVVERLLEKEGTSRKELGREEFVKRVWKWKEESGGKIIHQLRRLGASCDWSRERFTMDPGLSKAVRKIFVQLYKEDLIYRSTYLVNWSPKLQSAISDLEVEYKEVEGKLYYFKYAVHDSSEFIEVATTRPETILGDTAVAVHPDDSRYQAFIGKKLVHPFLKRQLIVIADENVDPTFGTGAVKITPAHDPNDYEMGKKHQLDFITILDTEAKIDCKETPFHRMDRFVARKKIVAALKEKNLFSKEEIHAHSVGHCDRTGSIIEPRVSKQWFVKIDSLAMPALKAVQDKKIEFVPLQWTKTYSHWMENIRDWCISRQLWWGHQIPVWYCDTCSHMNVSEIDPKQCEECSSSQLTQDKDVLDTWFSSGLWPFSTLGWPEKTDDLKKFYPTSVLVTGFDIIFFWVARMIMMGLKVMDDIPFEKIHIHALVRDEHGKKMSKSKGNVIDPLVLMDKYGTDAFRFSLTAFAAQGRDILLSEKRIEGYRNFMTKLWNASRFALQNVEGVSFTADELTKLQPKKLSNQWILSRLNLTIQEVRKGFDEMRFNESAQALYSFVWHEFCDWFIEVSKVDLNDASSKRETQVTICFALDQMLRLLHPISPFITEKIWQELPIQREEPEASLMTQTFPKENPVFSFMNEVQAFTYLRTCIEAIRNFRSENNIAPSKPIEEFVLIGDKDQSTLLLKHQEYIQSLCKITTIVIADKNPYKNENHSKLVFTQMNVEGIVPWKGLIDLEVERNRIKKSLKKLEQDEKVISGKVNNPNFREKAPTHVLKENEDKLIEIKKQLAKLKIDLDRMN